MMYQLLSTALMGLSLEQRIITKAVLKIKNREE